MKPVNDFFIPSKSNFSLREKMYLILWRIIQSSIFRFSPHILKKWRVFLLKLFGAKIGKNVFIDSSVKIFNPHNLSIGNNSAINFDTFLYSLDMIIIGDFVSISHRVHINTGSHDISKPSFDLLTIPVVINDGAFIGTDSFINLGVTIGKYTVVGARSVVVKDLPDAMVCVGHPCKPLKNRFIDE